MLTWLERRSRRNSLVEDFKAGLRVKQLGEKYNLCIPYIRVILRENGLKEIKPRKCSCVPDKNSVLRNQDILEQYLSGASLSELAHLYKVSRQRIEQIVKPGFDCFKKKTLPHHLKAARKLKQIEREVPSIRSVKEWKDLKSLLDTIWHESINEKEYSKYGSVYYGA